MLTPDNTARQIDVEIRFNANKVWMSRSMSLESRGGKNYLKLVANTNNTACSTVTQRVDLSQVTSTRPVCTHIRPDILELVRLKPNPLPTIAISFLDRNTARLWTQILDNIVSPDSSKGPLDSNKKPSTNQILQYPDRARHVSQVSYSSAKTDDSNPYETIDEYITEEQSPAGTPPPIPKKRLYDNELRLEILYDSVNNLIQKLKELEQREKEVSKSHSDRAIEIPAMVRTEPEVCSQDDLLVDIGDSGDQAEIEPYGYSRPMPDYPAPNNPATQIPYECYLEPSKGRTGDNPEYAQIRKNHVKIVWS